MTTRREMLATGAALAASGLPAIASPERFRIAVLGDYEGLAAQAPWGRLGDDTEVAFFGRPFESERAAASSLREFDALVLMRERTPLSRATLERLPRLRLIVFTGPNNMTLDYAAAVEQHIAVCTTSSEGTRRPAPPAVGGDAPAEMALALMMACARRIPAADALVRRGGWAFEPGMVLRGKTLGIAGYGNLGRPVGRYGLALGMTVMAWSRSLTDEMAQADGVSKTDLATLLRTSDVVSIHLPLTSSTRGVIGAKELALMKRSAMLINTARAAIVDQAAMIAALRSRRIAIAGLDVFDQEPLPKGHPLLQMSNVVLTPHLGYSIGSALVNMYAQTIDVLLSFRNGVVMNPYLPNDLG